MALTKVSKIGRFDEKCRPLSLDEGSKIWAERDIELGEELFISYGEHGNDQLVSSYGFTLNRADDVSVTLNLLRLACIWRVMSTFVVLFLLLFIAE